MATLSLEAFTSLHFFSFEENITFTIQCPSREIKNILENRIDFNFNYLLHRSTQETWNLAGLTADRQKRKKKERRKEESCWTVGRKALQLWTRQPALVKRMHPLHCQAVFRQIQPWINGWRRGHVNVLRS